ncbi:MAG TPA: PilN domain-containing protein [Longimicrobiales bacterium]|nr:PilN domain-containing protein [Longimicrobiales bacterium]
MIKINLLPSATKRSQRRLPSLSGLRPKGGIGMPSVDRWVLFLVIAWMVGPLLTAWLFFGARNQISDLDIAIESARMDSARYAEMRAANAILLARQDSIAQKLEIIQEIDAGRYAWVHVMDEISRALPSYTWLVNVTSKPVTSALETPRFTIEGRAGSTFALTEFMQELEASPFLRTINLMSTNQIREGEALIYAFVLEGEFQTPSPDLIQTVPIFQAREGD